MKITYSIVAPIFNELDNLPELYRRVKEVMDSTGETWELILVDDGSADGSTTAICELAREDKRVRPVILSEEKLRWQPITLKAMKWSMRCGLNAMGSHGSSFSPLRSSIVSFIASR